MSVTARGGAHQAHQARRVALEVLERTHSTACDRAMCVTYNPVGEHDLLEGFVGSGISACSRAYACCCGVKSTQVSRPMSALTRRTMQLAGAPRRRSCAAPAHPGGGGRGRGGGREDGGKEGGREREREGERERERGLNKPKSARVGGIPAYQHTSIPAYQHTSIPAPERH